MTHNEEIIEQRDNIFSETCPTCKGQMAKGNKFCCKSCAKEGENG